MNTRRWAIRLLAVCGCVALFLILVAMQFDTRSGEYLTPTPVQLIGLWGERAYLVALIAAGSWFGARWVRSRKP